MSSLARFILAILVATILVLVWLGWSAAGQAGRAAQRGDAKPVNATGLDR